MSEKSLQVFASQLIDSHCHFDFEVFDEDREQLLQQCFIKGISTICIPSVSPESAVRIQSLVESQAKKQSLTPSLYFAAGLHPWWVQKYQQGLQQKISTAGSVAIKNKEKLWQALAECVDHPNCIAIGECGLDALIDCPIEKQQEIFQWQIEFAKTCKKPLIIHSVKSHNAVLQQLKKFKPEKGGVIHAFSGSEEIARQYIDAGFYLGIGGTITYPRASKTIASVKNISLQHLLLETDAPDMPINGRQGKRNTPLQLLDIAQCLAELKGITVAELAKHTTDNAKKLFELA